MKKPLLFLSFLAGLLLVGNSAFAQTAPNITTASSYSGSPYVYTVGTAIASPPTSFNTGGTIPATTYGQVTTFAGSTAGTGGTGANPATGTAARFTTPAAIVSDGTNLYVADQGNNQIRKIVISTGVVTVFAGSTAGTAGAAVASATGTAARFRAPDGIAIDAAGLNLYVSDSGNGDIRKIVISSAVVTIYATGLNNPAGLCFTGTTLVVADQGTNNIKKVTTAGVVSVFAGSTGGTASYTNATGTAARFRQPADVQVDASGNIFVADQGNNVIREITTAGVVTTFAGPNATTGAAAAAGITNGTTTAARFNGPTGISIDGAGNFYIADAGNNEIREITPAGVVTLFAGSAAGTSGRVDAITTAASFNTLSDMYIDATDNMYVADFTNNNIRKVTLGGYTIGTTLPATLAFDGTTGTISGTPTVISSTTPYLITAYNYYGSSSKTISITCNPPAPVLAFSPTTQTGVTGFPMSFSVGNTGGAITGNYSISSGTLPPGLNFIPSGGTISGTPSVSTTGTAITISGTNAGGTAFATVTIIVSDPAAPIIAYPSPSPTYTFTQGTAIVASTTTPGNSGGPLPATNSYAISPTSFPAGVSFDVNTGIISGNPSVTWPTTSYTVTATNAGGSSSATFTITVNPIAPAISYTPSTVSYTLGTTISLSPANAGGPIVSYSAAALPAGLSIDPVTGIITGSTTAVSAQTSYIITATNAGGSGNATIKITVTGAGANTYDWTGAAADTKWENPANWDINGVPQAVDYPGSSSTADIVDIGVNTSIPVITSFPVISVANVNIASLTFGYNNAPQNNTGGTLGLTVNGFTLNVTGTILQQHSSTGPSSGTANGIVTTLQGSGFITCGSFTVGDNTLPVNFVSSITRVNIGSTTASTLSVTVNGNLTINSSNFGILFSFNASDAYVSLGAGTLTIKGTMQLTNSINGFPLISFSNPYAKFSMDLNSTNSPVLNLLGTTAITIANTGNGNISNVVDFNNPGSGAKTGTVNYFASTGTQRIFTSADADFDTSPAVYSVLTLTNPSAKTVDGGTLSTSSDFTTSGGAVNLNTNNPAVTVGGIWANSTTVTQGSGIITANGLFTNSGTFNAGSGSIFYDGDYTNTGTFAAGTGTVFFNKNGAQSVQDNSAAGTTFKNVTFENTGAKTMSTTGSGFFAVSSTGLLTMAGTATLATGNILTLRSDVNGSASVGQITTTNPITGNVSVERFLTGGVGFRSYRLLSSPVSTSLGSGIVSMNYLINSCYITGTTGTAGGFDFSLINNPSLYLFRENFFGTNGSFTSGNFRGVNDLNTGASNPPVYGIDIDGPGFTVYNGNGYLFFFRGDRSLASLATEGTSYTPTNTTLTATGALNQGQVKVKHWFGGSTALWETTISGSVNTEGFNLVGNPYASSIDWNTYSATTSSNGIYAPGVFNTMYILMPNGNYNVYVANFAGNKSIGGIPNSNIIPSGQGFFVLATGASPSITFNETAKTTGQATTAIGNLFMGAPPVAAISQYLHLLLTQNTVNEDGILINFNSSASAQYIKSEDAPYKTGSGPAGLSSVSSDNIALTINTLPLPKQGSLIIPLTVSATVNGTYQLNMAEIKSIPEIYEVWLMDAYTRDSLDFRQNAIYNFDITRSVAASYGAGRFTIVIRQNPALGVRLVSFNASKETKGAQIVWVTQNEKGYTNFTLERSIDNGKTFNILDGFISTGAGTYSFLDKEPRSPSDQYRLKIVDFAGAIIYSPIVTLTYSGSGTNVIAGNITVYPNPARSVINLSIAKSSILSSNPSALGKLNADPGSKLTEAKQSYDIKIISITGFVVKTATSQQPTWDDNVSNLLPGTYIVQVVNSRDKSLVGKTTFIKL